MEKRGICFEIQDECVAKGRPKFCKWGVYTPKKTKDYEKKVTFTIIKNGVENDKN